MADGSCRFKSCLRHASQEQRGVAMHHALTPRGAGSMEIGEDQKEYDFESPEREPQQAPVTEPVTEPAREPQPA
jgi:hypothetical protein